MLHVNAIAEQPQFSTAGVEVGDMQKKMMETIEELTLYVIQLKKELDTLKAQKEFNSTNQ